MDKIYVVQTEERNGKYFSFVSEFHVSDNLKSYWCFQDNNIVVVHLCSSKEQAEKLAKVWNQGYKENGNNLYSVM